MWVLILSPRACTSKSPDRAFMRDTAVSGFKHAGDAGRLDVRVPLRALQTPCKAKPWRRIPVRASSRQLAYPSPQVGDGESCPSESRRPRPARRAPRRKEIGLVYQRSSPHALTKSSLNELRAVRATA
jgi:hypothetical protein